MLLISQVENPLTAALLGNSGLFGQDRLTAVIKEMVVNYFEGETCGETVCHWLRTYELAWGPAESFNLTIGLPLWQVIYTYLRHDVGLDPEEHELLGVEVSLGAFPARLIYRLNLLSRYNREVLHYY